MNVRGRQRRGRVVLALAAALLPLALSAKAPRVPDPAHLRPGEFVWHPEVAPQGPVVVVVSLDEQRVYVYRNGIAIGFSTISSGRRGRETPPGVFTILQKERVHHSNLYDNAPMPYMERLTWDGLALHGGSLPGYPASHGCVRLPQKFAENLFEITRRGETVVVANDKAMAPAIVHPAVLAPVSAAGAPVDLSAGVFEPYEWDDAAAPEGPVSILVSTHDRRVHVLRNGVRIGSAALEVADGFSVGGSLLFVIDEGFEPRPSTLDPDRPRHRWSVFPVGTFAAPAPGMDELAAKLHVAPAFARRVYPILEPGTTVLVTDHPGVRAENIRTVLESAAAPSH